MIQIALDIMGGDNAPYSNINGAIKFLNSNSDVKLYLVGEKSLIESELSKFIEINASERFCKSVLKIPWHAPVQQSPSVSQGSPTRENHSGAT